MSDPGGAGVPGVQLLIHNIDTNMKQAVESDGTGLYSVSQLPPGRYTVTAQKDGFRKSVQTGIVLTVGQIATLNIPLQLGDVKETVTVEANAELINTTTAEMSSVVDQSSVAGLPLNGRDPSSLVLLTTGTMNILPGGSSAGSAVGGGWTRGLLMRVELLQVAAAREAPITFWTAPRIWTSIMGWRHRFRTPMQPRNFASSRKTSTSIWIFPECRGHHPDQIREQCLPWWCV